MQLTSRLSRFQGPPPARCAALDGIRVIKVVSHSSIRPQYSCQPVNDLLTQPAPQRADHASICPHHEGASPLPPHLPPTPIMAGGSLIAAPLTCSLTTCSGYGRHANRLRRRHARMNDKHLVTFITVFRPCTFLNMLISTVYKYDPLSPAAICRCLRLHLVHVWDILQRVWYAPTIPSRVSPLGCMHHGMYTV